MIMNTLQFPKQNDKEFKRYRLIQKYGCYFFSILYLYYKHTKIQSTYNNIIDMYTSDDIVDVMDRDCFVKSPNGVLKVIGTYFKRNATIQYEGTHSSNFISSPSTNEHYILGAFKHTFTHFVVLDGKGNTKTNVAYDPLGHSVSVAKGTLISTREYTTKK